jgi:hypothetical protein
VINSYRLQVPQTAVAPAQLDIATGLYDFYTGERLTSSSGNDLVYLAKVQVEPGSDNLPNPVAINFENELEMAGYEINPRRALPGDTIDLTLFWQANQSLADGYTFFAQIIGEDTTRWASHDLAPPEGTSSWESGDVQPLSFTLALDENTVSGLYPVIVGAYTQSADGNFDRLQILTPDGRLTDDFLELTRIRVD